MYCLPGTRLSLSHEYEYIHTTPSRPIDNRLVAAGCCSPERQPSHNIYIRTTPSRPFADWGRQTAVRLERGHDAIHTYEWLPHAHLPIGGGRLLFAWKTAITQYIHTNDLITAVCRLGAAGCAVRLKLKHGHHTIYAYEQLDHGRLTIGCCSPGARPSQEYIRTTRSRPSDDWESQKAAVRLGHGHHMNRG